MRPFKAIKIQLDAFYVRKFESSNNNNETEKNRINIEIVHRKFIFSG